MFGVWSNMVGNLLPPLLGDWWVAQKRTMATSTHHNDASERTLLTTNRSGQSSMGAVALVGEEELTGLIINEEEESLIQVPSDEGTFDLKEIPDSE